AILLPVYLAALGYSATAIGVISAMALFGSAVFTILIGFIGNRYDQRHLLVAASGLMIATGIGYAAAFDLAPLLLVAFVGTANPSAGNASIFVPLEHTVIARGAVGHERTRIFARYGLLG